MTAETLNTPATPTGASLLRPWMRVALAVALCVAALAVRWPHFEPHAFDFHPVRQYRAALMATGLAGGVGEVPAPVAQAYLDRNRLLEPPIAEAVTAVVWRTLGERDLRIPRGLSLAYWMLGAIALHALARRRVGSDAAFAASGFMLLAPFATAASTSFQPDPAMIAVTCAALLALERLAERPTRARFLTAAAACAAAVMLKPVAVFPLVCGGLARFGLGPRRWFEPKVLAFAFLSLLPTLLWTAWGTLFAGFLEAQAKQSLQPALLLEGRYWRGLARMLGASIGVVPLACGLVALFVARGVERRWLAGLFGAHVLYIATFTHHTSTHDYYHLPLFPTVGLALAVLAGRVLSGLRRVRRVPPGAAAGIWILTLVAAGAAGFVTARAQHRPRAVDFELAVAHGIGEHVGPATSVVCLASDLSKPLQYHAGFAAWNWPWSQVIEAWRRQGLAEATSEERLLELTDGVWPDWFCIAQTRELGRQPELRDWLEGNFPIAARGPHWLVYDLRR